MKTEKFYDKKEKRERWRARFELNKKTFRPDADTREELFKIIDEIRVQSRRKKHHLPTPETPGPTVREVFDKALSLTEDAHRKVFLTRVFNDFLKLLPDGIRAKQLKKSHYQIYIDWREPMNGKQSKKPVLMDTIYKELWAVSGALGKGELYWEELETWKKPLLPANKKQKPKKDRARTRIVSPEEELYVLLPELRKPREKRQTEYTETHRRRLADDLEFRYETGLRRKEVARLQKPQYRKKEGALRVVIRFKTNTVTKFLPLSSRAIEIIERRMNLSETSFIFTASGKPVDSDYRTLKVLCERLGIAYGKYTEDGFIPHDLRHNFANEIILHGDIETAREYLGHSNIQQTAGYLHTSEKRMKDAMRKKEGVDLKAALVIIYKRVRRKNLNARKFVEAVKKLVEK